MPSSADLSTLVLVARIEGLAHEVATLSEVVIQLSAQMAELLAATNADAASDVVATPQSF